MTAVGIAVLVALPALAFTAWPLTRRGSGRRFLGVPPDPREQLTERKRQLLSALRELDFEHDAGHVGDEDYSELRARYEAEAGEVLTALDRLGARPEPRQTPVTAARGWRHPAALAVCAVALLVFGIAIGAGLVGNTTPDTTASMPVPGSRPLASIDAPIAGPAADGTAPRPLAPEMLRGMLDAARASLSAGRYSEAIAAYQAILKRDPRNVDAITHLGVIVAVGGHADSALQAFDRALGIDPNFAPALLYRGQVLYAKDDMAGAIQAWEKFLTLSPSPQDRARVEKLLAEAKARK